MVVLTVMCNVAVSSSTPKRCLQFSPVITTVLSGLSFILPDRTFKPLWKMSCQDVGLRHSDDRCNPDTKSFVEKDGADCAASFSVGSPKHTPNPLTSEVKKASPSLTHLP